MTRDPERGRRLSTPRTIAVIGSINIDLVAVVARLPREGETVLASDYRVVCGGKGANQAVAAAVLGGRVHMVGCVGDDEYGRVAKSNLAAHGVGVRAVRTVAGAHTGVALIVVDDRGRNVIAVAPNANSDLRVPRRPFDIAVMQLETPYSRPRARLFILNPAPARPDALERAAPRRKRPLRGVDLVVPNEHEAEILTGRRDPARAAAALLRMGARQALITLGADGVFDGGCAPGATPVVGVGHPRHHAAFAVRVTDTVGAGDAFIGALAAALAEGHADPLRFAQAAAALKCTRPGAQRVPPRREVDRLAERGEYEARGRTD